MRFIEANERSEHDLSDVAMTYDGVLLDDQIEAFRTLNVIGREFFNKEVDAVRTHDGFLPIDVRTNPEPLIVEYMIDAEDSDGFFEAYEELMSIVSPRDARPITFEDNEAVFFGIVTNFSIESNINNTIVGTFEIFREDGYKYSEPIITSGQMPNSLRTLVIEELIIRPNASLSTLTLEHDGLEIRIIDPVNASDEIRLDFRHHEVFKNGEPFDYGLDFSDDFDRFTVKSGDIVTSNDATLEFRVRERWE